MYIQSFHDVSMEITWNISLIVVQFKVSWSKIKVASSGERVRAALALNPGSFQNCWMGFGLRAQGHFAAWIWPFPCQKMNPCLSRRSWANLEVLNFWSPFLQWYDYDKNERADYIPAFLSLISILVVRRKKNQYIYLRKSGKIYTVMWDHIFW